MSRARHKMDKACRANGGGIGGRDGMWVSGNPDVKKEAEELKRGGKVKKKGGMHAEGKKASHRMDRPKRARGGKVSGSNMNPFSSAHSATGKGIEPKVQDNRGMKVSD